MARPTLKSLQAQLDKQTRAMLQQSKEMDNYIQQIDDLQQEMIEQEAAYQEELVKLGGGSQLTRQEGGDHYSKLGKYQPWNVLSKWMTPEEMKGAVKRDVIAYLCREADKGGREDIKKAHHTLGIYLELTEE